ncbi:hypothetical protein CAP48_19690 (plasmid) [Advenella sp. S44]|nr:hypothetical protein CAP48_19690 [Advenella sp. S44]
MAFTSTLDEATQAFDERHTHYWTHPGTGRYYAASLIINLFGQWELKQAWGSLSSRRGRLRYVPLTGLAEGQAQLQRVVQRRLQRGYVAG